MTEGSVDFFEKYTWTYGSKSESYYPPFTPESPLVTDAGDCPKCKKNTWVIESLSNLRVEISCLNCGYRRRITVGLGMEGEVGYVKIKGDKNV